MLKENGYSFTSSEMIAVEIYDASKLRDVLYALVEAELNIHYIYPFIIRPNGKSALAMHLEDIEIARNSLEAHQLKVLKRSPAKQVTSLIEPWRRARGAEQESSQVKSSQILI